MLHFFYAQGKVLTQQGLSLLLLRSSGEGANAVAEDFDLMAALAGHLSPQAFYHPKLDANLQKAI